MKTKYDIGQVMNIPMEIISVYIEKGKTKYSLLPLATNCDIWNTICVTEDKLEDADMISAKDYEEEVNKLKDEIERLKSEIDRYKELYQFEHEQVAKVKDLLETMKSHLPERNSYGG